MKSAKFFFIHEVCCFFGIAGHLKPWRCPFYFLELLSALQLVCGPVKSLQKFIHTGLCTAHVVYGEPTNMITCRRWCSDGAFRRMTHKNRLELRSGILWTEEKLPETVKQQTICQTIIANLHSRYARCRWLNSYDAGVRWGNGRRPFRAILVSENRVKWTVIRQSGSPQTLDLWPWSCPNLGLKIATWGMKRAKNSNLIPITCVTTQGFLGDAVKVALKRESLITFREV